MAMDQQAAMERLRELYLEKNEHLAKFLEPVTPFEFYREIFPVGSFERKGHFEDAKGNGIAVTVPKAAGIALEIEGDGKAKRYTITDELSELAEVFDTDFTIMSLCLTLGGGGVARTLGISMPWSLIWMGWVCPSSGTRCTR